MGIFSGIMICSDLDGTLADKSIISKENADAISYFQDNGGLFTIISGRSFEYLEKYVSALGIKTYVGCINGTVIRHAITRDTVYSDFMRGDYAERVLNLIRLCSNIKDVDLFTDEKSLCFSTDCADLDARLAEALSLPLHKILIHGIEPFTSEQLSVIRATLGEKYTVARSWESGVELQNASFGKGAAARMIARLEEIKTLVCIGDYENDISMLEQADIGYAVANAVDTLKAVATRITADVSNGAVAHVIRDIRASL